MSLHERLLAELLAQILELLSPTVTITPHPLDDPYCMSAIAGMRDLREFLALRRTSSFFDSAIIRIMSLQNEHSPILRVQYHHYLARNSDRHRPKDLFLSFLQYFNTLEVEFPLATYPVPNYTTQDRNLKIITIRVQRDGATWKRLKLRSLAVLESFYYDDNIPLLWTLEDEIITAATQQIGAALMAIDPGSRDSGPLVLLEFLIQRTAYYMVRRSVWPMKIVSVDWIHTMVRYGEDGVEKVRDRRLGWKGTRPG